MNCLLKTFLVSLAGIQGLTLAASSRPKLLVGIMVDQLRTDYIEDLREMLGEGGFRRLMDEGVYFTDVDFKVPGGDAASASAIIQTGSYPKQNGISSSLVFDPNTNTLKSVFNDEAYIGNFTSETYSPSALRVTTLTDEITIENKGKSKIHSIAPDASQAIVLAGHTGNSAFWINDESGRCSSTTYYSPLPTILQNKNYNSPLISRLDTMRWMPLRKDEPYPYVSSDEIDMGFRHTFSRSDKDVFSLYKNSPYVNRDITDAAIEYLNNLNIGKNAETTDVLNLGYTLAVYPNSGNSNYRYELQDSYLRLDKDLQRLFSALDKQVGKDNVLVYLFSTGYFTEPSSDYEEFKVPGGTFSVKRALSLLNAFLSAKYGNGAYVNNFADHQVFFSKSVLEEKNLDINKVAEESRDFLVKMSGVSDAFILSDLMSLSGSHLDGYRKAVDPKTAGDIIIEFNPGWKVIDDSRYPPVTIDNKVTAYKAPGFIMGADIAPRKISDTVEAVSIAPTIAGKLRIRSPNSAETKPLDLLK